MKKLGPVLFFLLCVHIFASSVAQEIVNPNVKWRFRSQGPVRSSAILVEEKLLFGSADGYLYSVNKQDGSLLWKFQSGGAITASPAADASSVYLSSRDNSIYSLDISTGRRNWRYEMQSVLPDGAAGWEYFSAAPVVYEDQVFVGSGDGHLYVLDKEKGKLKWKFKTNGRIRATPLIKEGVVYQPSNDGYVYVLNLNGNLLWKFETRGATYDSRKSGFDRNSIYTQPSIKNNLLVFGSRDGNVYAVDLDTHLQKHCCQQRSSSLPT